MKHSGHTSGTYVPPYTQIYTYIRWCVDNEMGKVCTISHSITRLVAIAKLDTQQKSLQIQTNTEFRLSIRTDPSTL